MIVRSAARRKSLHVAATSHGSPSQETLPDIKIRIRLVALSNNNFFLLMRGRYGAMGRVVQNFCGIKSIRVRSLAHSAGALSQNSPIVVRIGCYSAAMKLPRGKDIGSAILFWLCAAIVWGSLAAVVAWSAVKHFY